MNSWVNDPVILKGQTVDLLPLEEKHFPELHKLAADKRIWEFYVLDGSDPKRFDEVLNEAISAKKSGSQYPFIIFHNGENRIIGSTRFLDIQPFHKKLEIGWTWLHPDHWGSEVNFECKLLLLEFCFENLKAVRVQLKTDENNLRSRKAIEKIGGKFEGILRHDMIRDNGTFRNSAYYSILNTEWPTVKPMLKELYEKKKEQAKLPR